MCQTETPPKANTAKLTPGAAGAAGQGPYLQLYAKVDGLLVKGASYQTYTCPNAIACGSWLVRWMEGRGPEMLVKLEAEDLIRMLGGLSPGKEHCAYMAVTALRDLLAQWGART